MICVACRIIHKKKPQDCPGCDCQHRGPKAVKYIKKDYAKKKDKNGT